MFNVLCEECRENPATVFVTKIINHEASKQQLCEACARKRASGEGWMQHLTGVLDGPEAMEEALNRALDTSKLEEMMAGIFDGADPLGDLPMPGAEEDDSFESALSSYGEFPADEDLIDDMEDAEAELDSELEALTTPLPDISENRGARAVPDVRCPKCSTTWDRLRQDGRAGCAHCYAFFSTQLSEVLLRIQKSAQHTGKTLRAAAKRHRRLEHLRARRDHRLSMLNQRLKMAVEASRYEDAAKIRDKIKIVASTIVSDES